MFADATTCITSDNNIDHLVSNVNNELRRIARWFRANKMAVNVGETKFFIFHTSGRRFDRVIQLNYDGNEPNKNDPILIHPIECFHSKHPIISSRAYIIHGFTSMNI
jgi:hypothetical protein